MISLLTGSAGRHSFVSYFRGSLTKFLGELQLQKMVVSRFLQMTKQVFILFVMWKVLTHFVFHV
jgi:hypothetical protein